eukprot:7391576-Prymnesium_polylepis.2
MSTWLPWWPDVSERLSVSTATGAVDVVDAAVRGAGRGAGRVCRGSVLEEAVVSGTVVGLTRLGSAVGGSDGSSALLIAESFCERAICVLYSERRAALICSLRASAACEPPKWWATSHATCWRSCGCFWSRRCRAASMRPCSESCCEAAVAVPFAGAGADATGACGSGGTTRPLTRAAELLLGTLDGRGAKYYFALRVDDEALRRELIGGELAWLLARTVAKEQAVKVLTSAHEPVERSRVCAKSRPHPSAQHAVLGHLDVHHETVRR